MITTRQGLSAAVLILALTGCGTQQSDGPTTVEASTGNAAAGQTAERIALDALPAAPTKGLAKGLTLPLDEYTYSAKDRYIWQVAVQQQWRTCMSGYGFTDFAPPAPSADIVTAQAESDMGRRYGVTDAADAQRNGYHLVESAAESPHWEPAPGAETAVFTGSGPELSDGSYNGKAVPEGGCRGEAARAFPLPQSTEAEEAEVQTFEQSRDDSRVVAAVAAWSSCMSTKGYQVKHPFDAPDLVGESISAAEPSAEEIALASADIACKKTSSLVSTWHKVEQEKQETKISQRQSVLTTNKKARDAAVAKAVTAYEEGAK
ncbi:hypothetical protein [Streptomyces sp. YS415]|uniref:hypothetical protein n=1 Tax=Streptomyces sp. YS415 TaxID=2944806 RepID=UPI002021CE2A|nr:hypothetical protein [Streptomyces sp. YS415]MCL7427112.1 hypothetical protein [Streptomyces sp. YS415]